MYGSIISYAPLRAVVTFNLEDLKMGHRGLSPSLPPALYDLRCSKAETALSFYGPDRPTKLHFWCYHGLRTSGLFLATYSDFLFSKGSKILYGHL